MHTTPRPKRYIVNVAALVMTSQLGTIDPENHTRTAWDPDSAVERLAAVTAQPGFDAETYCTRCESYDRELAIQPHQLRLPRLRPERLRQLLKEPVGLPWEPGKPACDVHVKASHKARPPQPARLDSCHQCLLSFLDEQELPDVPPEVVEALKAEFREARDNLRRLLRAKAHPGAPASFEAYREKLLQGARARLRTAYNACRDAGFEPARPKAVRQGDDAPDQVVATELEIHHLLPARTGGEWFGDDE